MSTPAIVINEVGKSAENGRDVGDEMKELALDGTQQDSSRFDPIVYGKDRTKELDFYAVNAPASCQDSVESLATHLSKCPSKGGLSDQDKVRLIFRWITNNISYAAEEVYGGGGEDTKPLSTDPSEILRTGRSACTGYAGLFDQLAKLMGIESLSVSGYAKGFSWKPETVFVPGEKTDHAWNAVKLKGNWYLLDVTWATGYINKELKFNWFLDEHYFLTDPKKFVFDHFPVDEYKEDSRWSTWQLLESPVSLAEYNKLPKVTSTFFKLGISLSELVSKLLVEEEGAFIVKSTEPLELTARFYEKSSEKTHPNCLFMELKKGYKEAHFHVLAPHNGDFLLRIYGKRRGDVLTKDPVNLLTYLLRCVRSAEESKEVSPRRVFPTLSGAWGATPAFDALGLTMIDDSACAETRAASGAAEVRLRLRRDVVFTHSLEAAEGVELPPGADLTRQVFQQYVDKDVVAFVVRPPVRGYYKLGIFGQTPENTNPKFPQLLSVMVNAKEVLERHDLRPFPAIYQGWTRGCRLLNPLEGVLGSKAKYDCSLICPDVCAIMIATENDTYLMESLEESNLPGNYQISNRRIVQDMWHCKFKTGRSGSVVGIFVQRNPEKDDFVGFLEYSVE